jgi:hypothetical protein
MAGSFLIRMKSPTNSANILPISVSIWQIKYLQLVHLFEHALVQVFSETIWLKPATLAELEQTCMTFKSGKVPGFKQYTHAYY